MAAALADQLANAAPDAPVMVFVHSTTIDQAVHAADAAGLDVVSHWARIGVAVAIGTPAAIQRVALDPAVRYVEPDAPVEQLLDTAHKATGADDARNPTFGLLDVSGNPFDGTGITIAINDGGVDGTHPMLSENGTSKVVRNLRQACVETVVCDEWIDVSDSDPAGGHGTHVAGIAAGYERTTANGRTVRGAAPGASLVGLGSGAGLTVYATTAGLNWVLEHHEDPCGDGSCPPIRVVNNSWGPTGGGAFNPSDVVNQMADALVADGVVVVFAAGNGDATGDGGDGSDDRVNPYAKNPTPGVIGVANYDDGGTGSRDNALDSSSSRGLKTDPTTYPDIAAPGANITSACTYTLPICRSSGDVSDPYYAAISGTSMASPYIAGVAAVLLDANPALTPAQIEDVLEDNAHQFGAAADYVPDPRNPDHTTSFDRGHGLVDVTASLAEVLGRTIPVSAPACGGGASITDPEGDATDVLVPTGAPAAASEKALDILDATVSTNATDGALTFTVHVKDLGDLPPAGALGEFIRYTFTFGGTPYTLTMERLGGSAEASVSFSLQTVGVTNEVVAADLVGSFNATTDMISATLPANAFNVWKPALPVVGNGDLLSGLDVLTQRRLPPLTISTDEATGACPYIVGS